MLIIKGGLIHTAVNPEPFIGDLLVDGGHTLNSWLVPLKRELPPRVTPEEEVVQLKHDLDLLGIPYDENGINEELHPNMAEAFKAMFS